MTWVTEIGVYFRVTDPRAESSIRVAHFIAAIARRATDLRQLVLCAASDRYYEHQCPFDILVPFHPVVQAVLSTIARKTVKNLKIRVHDDAAFSPGLACHIQKAFERSEPAKGQTLMFTKSCTCPKGCPVHAKEGCHICGRPRKSPKFEDRPIEDVIPAPEWCEASAERMMEMEEELFELGIIGAPDPFEGEHYDDQDCECCLFHDIPAFDSNFCYDGDGNPHSHMSTQTYRGKLKAPNTWFMKQSKITDFFLVVTYNEYLAALPSPYKDNPERPVTPEDEKNQSASVLKVAGIGSFPFYNKAVLEALV